MIGTSGDLKRIGQQVAEEGFSVLAELLPQRELLILRRELSCLQEKRGRAGTRHVQSHPTVAALANDPRLLSIASEVLGPAAFPFRATLFDKSANANWLITWHQDTALPLQEKREVEGWSSWSVKDHMHYAHAPATALEQILALRVHLDDSTADNGPLRVLPGSHRLGVLSDAAIVDMASRQDAVSCLVMQGGIVAMRPLIVHASSKSRSSSPRGVLHIEYAATANMPGGLRLAIPSPSSQTSTKPN